MPFGPDNQMENKTKEIIGKYAELKCACTLEGNSNEKKKKMSSKSALPWGSGVSIRPHESGAVPRIPLAIGCSASQTLLTLIYSKKYIFH